MGKSTVAGGPSYVDGQGNPQAGPLNEHPLTGEALSADDPNGTNPSAPTALQVRPEDEAGHTAEHVEVGPDTEGPEPTDEQFNPEQHTVKDVEAYLEDADDDERVRVLQAEADGKARPTLLNGKYAAQATEPDDAHDGQTYTIE